MSAIDIDQLAGRVAGWAAMRFFPPRDEKYARLEIVKAVASMAGTYERACWIVDQMLALTNDWPGIVEVRGVFCHRFLPADGVSAESKLCPDGHIPDASIVGFTPLKELGTDSRYPRDRSLPAAAKELLGPVRHKRLAPMAGIRKESCD